MSDYNYYKVGGSLEYQHPTYVVRKADADLYEGLHQGEFCYVLNSRQMGKSSLRVQMMKKLKEQGIKCASIDMTRIGSHVAPQEWYAGVISELLRGFGLSRKVDFSTWWRQRELLPPLQRLRELIEDVLLAEFSQNLVIFLDEIDSILKIQFKDDFFAFIRACYNQRVDNPEYDRLTFCLLGVATPSDLIQDKQRTPFNVGRAIELTGFQWEEAKLALTEGLTQKVDNPEQVVEEVLAWTDGQPFLTQKLCQLVVEKAESRKPNIERLVQKHLIDNWEAQDEPEHLRTIRDRLLNDEKRAVSLLGLYQQILQQGEVAADDSSEQTELRLSGLVVRQQGKLRAYNRIYESVFNLLWVEKELASLRPYAKTLTAWLASNCQDESQLLSGQALEDAQAWSEGKSLSTQDYQFLAASQKKTNEILNQIVWELVSPLSVEEVTPQVAALVKRLQQVSGDDSLALLNIEAGSTILVLKGSQDGFERIRFLLSTGQLTDLLGIPVLNVRQRAFEPISSSESITQLVSEEVTPDEMDASVSLLDSQAVAQYQQTQAFKEQQTLRMSVPQEFEAYLRDNLGSEAAEWLRLYLQGQSQEAIAKALNKPIKEVYRLREKISYHAIRVFSIKGKPELVASWLETSLQEHSLGLTPAQWQEFWENLTPVQRQLLEQRKAGKSLEAIAKDLNLKINQVIGEWSKLYLAAQAFRTTSSG